MRSRVVLSAVAIVALVATATAFADAQEKTIPNTFYACAWNGYLIPGSMQVGRVPRCARGTVLFSWNSEGRPGPVGPQGEQGPVGPAGSSGTSGVEVRRFTALPDLSSGDGVTTSLGYGLKLVVSCPAGDTDFNHTRAYLVKGEDATESMWLFGTSGLPGQIGMNEMLTGATLILDYPTSLSQPAGVIVQGTSHLWRIDAAILLRDASTSNWCRVDGVATVSPLAGSPGSS